MEQNSSKSNKVILIALIASLGINVYQWSSNNNMQNSYDVKVDSLVTARIDVEKELNDTYTELNQYKGINSKLDSLLLEANGKVDEQKLRIENLMRKERNNTALNKKLKMEMEDLKNLRDEYLEKIDQLLVENDQLKKERNELTSTVASLTQNLETTVATASVLKSEYYKVTAYKKRSNNKYTETAMAKRTNKIEACFTLLENLIAQGGQKNVYLRIIEPGGKVLGNRSEGSNTFRKTGSEEDILYTSTKSINYEKTKQDICLTWEEAEQTFSSGSYMIEVYVDGTLSGASSLNLR